MDSSCPQDRLRATPSGKSRTGRKIPKTPGSKPSGEERIGILLAASAGLTLPEDSNTSALRATRATRAHRRHHVKSTATTPIIHAAASIRETGLEPAGIEGGVWNDGDIAAGTINGWL